MIKKITQAFATAAFTLCASLAAADSWVLDADASKLAFGSVKKDTVGEVHHFESLSGTVSSDGVASIEIDLTSVQTWIDIRNERIGEHVFGGAATATLTAQIDMAEMDALAAGDSTITDVTGTLNLLGTDIELDIPVFVSRLSEGQVMVTTDEMLFVGTADLGIDAGIAKLMELAKLPGITRAVPVTFRFVFNSEMQKAEAAPAAPATAAVLAELTGDAKKGKRVWNKCRACHKLDDGKNGVGPHLFGVVGRDIAAVDGFKYSDALTSKAGEQWTVENLTAFLTKPKDFAAGTNMQFAGLKKPTEIEDLIAYMASEN